PLIAVGDAATAVTPLRQGGGVPRCPVVLPVHPGRIHLRNRVRAAAAARAIFLDLAEKAPRPAVRDVAQPVSREVVGDLKTRIDDSLVFRHAAASYSCEKAKRDARRRSRKPFHVSTAPRA